MTTQLYQDARDLWNVAEGEPHEHWIRQMQQTITDLKTERQRHEQAEQSLKRLQVAVMHGQSWSEALDENDKLRNQLLSALAEIEKYEWLIHGIAAPKLGHAFRSCDKPCSGNPKNFCPTCLAKYWQSLPKPNLSALHQHDAERESEAIKRLGDILTGGNASTWEQIFHGAENVAEVRKPLVEALERIRDESTALADACKFPNSVLHIESPLRIKREANDALAKVKTASHEATQSKGK